MSERGSFVTQYVYCTKCFNSLIDVLLQNNCAVCSRVAPTWEEPHEHAMPYLPIISGKISGGTTPGGELETMVECLLPEIEKRICHPVRIAVLAEEGERIYYAKPLRAKEEWRAKETVKTLQCKCGETDFKILISSCDGASVTMAICKSCEANYALYENREE